MPRHRKEKGHDGNGDLNRMAKHHVQTRPPPAPDHNEAGNAEFALANPDLCHSSRSYSSLRYLRPRPQSCGVALELVDCDIVAIGFRTHPYGIGRAEAEEDRIERYRPR